MEILLTLVSISITTLVLSLKLIDTNTIRIRCKVEIWMEMWWRRRVELSRVDLQSRSITRRPSDNRPVDLWKKVRPLGRFTGKPSPDTSPPVSEFESPNTNRTAALSHPPPTLALTAKEQEKIHSRSRSRRCTEKNATPP